MGKVSKEFKAGLMIVICVVSLGFLTVKVGNIKLFREGYSLKAQFNFASGIKKNAPIQLAGVEAGTVKDIEISYGPEGTKIILHLWLDSSAKVRTDSDVYISTMGLMGEKYVEITRGSKGAAYVQAGSLLEGKDPIMMEEVMDKALDIAGNLDREIDLLASLTKNVDEVLQKNRLDIDTTIDNLRDTSENFKEFSEDIKRHPWKLIMKTKEKKRKTKPDRTEGNKGFLKTDK